MNRRNGARRGAIFVVALGITLVLSAMLLVYAEEMRNESMLAASRVSGAQADAVEQGAEQWVLAQIEANVTPLPSSGSAASSSSSSNSSTVTNPTLIPAEALQVGGGYFWILRPDPTQDQTYGFGIADESAKLNVNSANATQLALIPNMTQQMASDIVSYPSTAGPSGSAITYETPEELLMVDTLLTPQILYGYDLNHDGVIDDAERAASGGAALTNGTNADSRGIFNYITTFSTNAAAGTTGRTQASPRGPQTIGLINVNTAPVQVLMCLPNMTTSDAQTLVTTRTNTQETGTKWVAQAINPTEAAAIAPFITGVSYQYSADIVAVSGDARSFKRERIVVDIRASPAKIVYRKDLTSLGWPLPARVRTSMQQGKGVPQDVTGTTNAQTVGGIGN
jgi:DNA uptake protein ComE-like DNA-binding protein